MRGGRPTRGSSLQRAHFRSGQGITSSLILAAMEPATTTPRLSRIRGWLLIVIGIGLSFGMLWLIWFLSWTIAHNNEPGHSHWSGSQQFTKQVFQLFGTILLFGVVSLIGGILQLRRGRTSWPIVVVSLGLFAVMGVLGWQIIQAKP
jgi:hypothetical protein